MQKKMFMGYQMLLMFGGSYLWGRDLREASGTQHEVVHGKSREEFIGK